MAYRLASLVSVPAGAWNGSTPREIGRRSPSSDSLNHGHASRRYFSALRYPFSHSRTNTISFRQQRAVSNASKRKDEGAKSSSTGTGLDDSDVLDYAPMLSAPVDSNFVKQKLEQIDQALERRQVAGLDGPFLGIPPAAYDEMFGRERWAKVSKVLEDYWSQPNAHRFLKDILTREPELYGVLSTMALEAAIRDEYHGLYTLFLVLLSAGRPEMVINTYERYRKGLFKHRGTSMEDLNSFDRAVRLAARPASDGAQPLSMVYLAALTLLNQINPARLIPIFNTKCVWSANAPLYRKSRSDTIAALRRGGLHKEVAKYERNTEDFLFITMCYHPLILAERIRNPSFNFSAFDEIYQNLLRLSIGPDRVLRPTSAYIWRGVEETSPLSLPPVIWSTYQAYKVHFLIAGACLHAMGALGRPLEIVSLLETVLPERGLTPTDDLIAKAMIQLTVISASPKLSDDTRSAAQQGLSRIVAFIQRLSMEKSDAIISGKIDVLRILFDQRGILGQFKAFERLPRNIGPRTRAALVRALLVLARSPERARIVLSWTEFGDMEIVKPSSMEPYRAYVRGIEELFKLDSGKIYHPVQKLADLEKVIENGRTPKGEALPISDQGAILAVRLLASGPEAVAEESNKMVSLVLERHENAQNALAQWDRALLGFLGRSRTHLSLTKAEVGYRFLLGFAHHGSTFVTALRSSNLFGRYIKAVSTSTAMSGHERIACQARAVLLHQHIYSKFLRLIFSVLEAQLAGSSISSHKRSGFKPRLSDFDAAAGLGWWRYMKRVSTFPDNPLAESIDDAKTSAPTIFWTQVIYGFRRAGRPEIAASLLAEAWNNASVPLFSSFWDEMREAGLLYQAGLTGYQLAEARKLDGGGRVSYYVDEREQASNAAEQKELEEQEELNEESEDEEGTQSDPSSVNVKRTDTAPDTTLVTTSGGENEFSPLTPIIQEPAGFGSQVQALLRVVLGKNAVVEENASLPEEEVLAEDVMEAQNNDVVHPVEQVIEQFQIDSSSTKNAQDIRVPEALKEPLQLAEEQYVEQEVGHLSEETAVTAPRPPKGRKGPPRSAFDAFLSDLPYDLKLNVAAWTHMRIRKHSPRENREAQDQAENNKKVMEAKALMVKPKEPRSATQSSRGVSVCTSSASDEQIVSEEKETATHDGITVRLEREGIRAASMKSVPMIKSTKPSILSEPQDIRKTFCKPQETVVTEKTIKPKETAKLQAWEEGRNYSQPERRPKWTADAESEYAVPLEDEARFRPVQSSTEYERWRSEIERPRARMDQEERDAHLYQDERESLSAPSHDFGRGVEIRDMSQERHRETPYPSSTRRKGEARSRRENLGQRMDEFYEDAPHAHARYTFGRDDSPPPQTESMAERIRLLEDKLLRLEATAAGNENRARREYDENSREPRSTPHPTRSARPRLSYPPRAPPKPLSRRSFGLRREDETEW